jgi:WD40 repeat protein
MTKTYRYDAFLSYSQSDTAIAAELQRSLERFAKPWYRGRALRIFRDRTSLNINESLWRPICEAIEQSRHFVLLASPEAARSEWVHREIEERKKHGGGILIVQLGGTIKWDENGKDFDWSVTNALPAALRAHFPEQPLYLDLCWATQGKALSRKDPRLLDMTAALAAHMHGKDKDELWSEAIREERRARRTAIAGLAAIVVLAVSSIVLASFAFDAKQRAEEHAAREADARQQAEHYAASEAVARQHAEEMRAEAMAEVKLTQNAPTEAMAWLLRTQPSLDNARRAHQAVSAGLSWVLRREDDHTFAKALAWSPDGRRLAVGGDPEGAVELWDVTQGRLRLLQGHGDQVMSLQWDPKGHLISGSLDGSIRFWNVEDGKEIGKIDVGGEIYAISLRPEGDETLAALTVGMSRQLRSLGISNHKEVFPDTSRDNKGTGPFTSLAWSPDGELLAVGIGEGNSIVNVSNAQTGKLWTYKHGAAIEDLAWSPDGSTLASASLDGTVYLWSRANQELRTIDQPSGGVHAITWSPDGTHLAVASADSFGPFEFASSSQENMIVKLWELSGAEPKLVKSLYEHRGYVQAIGWSPDGTMLAAAGTYETRLWDLRQRQDPAHPAESSMFGRIRWSRDGTALMVANERGVHLWRGETRVPVMPESAFMFAMDWSPAGGLLALSAGLSADLGQPFGPFIVPNLNIHLFDEELQKVRTLAHASGGVEALAWSPDGLQLASATSSEGYLYLWDSRTWQARKIELASRARVTWLFWSSDGKRLTVTHMNRAFVWDVATGEYKALDAYVDGYGGGARWSREGSYLAGPGEGGIIRLWRASDLKQFRELVGHIRPVTDLCWSPVHPHVLASSGDDNSVRIWDITTGNAIVYTMEETVNSIDWLPDGTALTVKDQKGRVHTLSVPLGQAGYQRFLQHWAKNMTINETGTPHVGAFSGTLASAP